MEKVLITGGLGYLGGRLVRHLQSQRSDSELRLIARRDDKFIPEWARGLDIAQADIRDETKVTEALDGIDTVIHLAAIDEIEAVKNPQLALEVNAIGTYRLLEAARKQKVRRFLFFSTFHVYGPKAQNPITEETIARPVHPYSLTHHTGEDLTNWFNQSFGLQTIIVRVSNGYGYPADAQVNRWSLVFNDFCRQAVEQSQITIRSSGKQHRDFIAITDVVNAVSHLLDLGPEIWNAGLFNLGGDCSLSIAEVAGIVTDEYRQRTGREIPIYYGSDPPGINTEPVVFDSSKLKNTGFILTCPLSQEVQGTLEVCESPSASVST